MMKVFEIEEPIIDDTESSVSDDVKTLARGTGITLLAHLAGRLVHLFTDILVARIFGPAAFGLYAIAWNLHRLLVIFSGMGMPNGLIIFGVKYWKNDSKRFRGIFGAGFLFAVFLGGVVALVTWTSAEWVAVHLFTKPDVLPAIRVAGLVIPFTLLTAFFAAMTRITKRMQFSMFVSEIVTTFGMLIVFLIVYWLTGQFFSVWAGMIVSYILSAGVGFFFVLRLFPELRASSVPFLRESAVELFLYSLPTALAGSFASVSLWSNRLIAGILLPVQDVGLYQAASQFNNIFGLLLASIVSVFVPMIAGLYQQGDLKKLGELYKITTKWGLYLNLPILIVALTMPAELMKTIYGDSYESGWLLLVILTIGQLINVSTGGTSAIFLMTKHQQAWANFALAAFALNILGAFILVPFLGVTGIAIAVLLGSVCVDIGGTWWISAKIGIWPYDKRYFKGVFAAILATCFISLAAWLPLPPSWLFMTRVGIGFIVYAVTLLLLRLDNEDSMFISELKRLVFKKLSPQPPTRR